MFQVTNMSFNTIRENKILAKISIIKLFYIYFHDIILHQNVIWLLINCICYQDQNI